MQEKIFIPQTMKALVLDKFGSTPRYTEVSVPRPGLGEVLVRMEVAPINPADLSFQKGYYSSVKKLPVTLGSEGTGVVVETGSNDPYSLSLVGKKVALIVEKGQHGTYSEYAIAETIQLIPFPEEFTFEEGASGIVNPLSTILMYKKVLERKDEAVISNPGASALGRMLHRLMKYHGIPVINIVRRKEQADIIIAEEKCEHVLITDDVNFEEDLKKLSKKLKATVSFDAVGGPLAGQILKCMPEGSTAYIYGNLSMKNSEASQFDLIFQKKKIKGFWLSTQLKRTSKEELAAMYKEIGPLYRDVLSTKFTHKYPLQMIGEATRYYLKHMSEGKVLLTHKVENIEKIPYPHNSTILAQNNLPTPKL